MQPLVLCRVACGILAFLGLLAAPLALGEDGRDFAGFYGVKDVTDLGADVGLNMTLEVLNFSGADVTDATITLEDPSQPNTPFGFFTVVSIPYREAVRLSDWFTVPKSEYDSWQTGIPSLRIEFYDAAGNAVERPIEIGWMLLDEGV